MINSTFISGIEVGRVNHLETGFNQMKTLFLYIFGLANIGEFLTDWGVFAGAGGLFAGAMVLTVVISESVEKESPYQGTN